MEENSLLQQWKNIWQRHTLKCLAAGLLLVLIAGEGSALAYAGLEAPARTALAVWDRDAINENCLSCHEDEIEKIHGNMMDADRDCMRCHSDVTHGMLRPGR